VASLWEAGDNQSAFISGAVLRDAFVCMAAGQLKTAMTPNTNLAPPLYRRDIHGHPIKL
jgi:hypothetical protein